MKSIMRICSLLVMLLVNFSLLPTLSYAMNLAPKTKALENKLETKIESDLMAWIRFFYASEVKDCLKARAVVTLVPGKSEYLMRPLRSDITYEVKTWNSYKTIVLGSTIKYQQDLPADFVRLFETEDALFAYAGMLAQGKKLFQGNLKDLFNEGLISRMADFMMRSGKNPYGYLQFIKHLQTFLGKEINPDDFEKATNLIDGITRAKESQKNSFEFLSPCLLMKSYVENTMQVVAQKLGIANQFKSYKVNIFENDNLGLYIFAPPSGSRSLTLRLPKKWSEAFSSEDQLVALVVYALIWDQEVSLKNGACGPDLIEGLDRKIVDTLLAMKLNKQQDLDSARGYNPKEYFTLLTRIARTPKKFEGLLANIDEALKLNHINANARITALQSYLMKLEIKHADEFADIVPFQIFAKKAHDKRSFKMKKSLKNEGSKPAEVMMNAEGLPSTITFQEFTNYLSDNEDNTKLDLAASNLIKLLPKSELTFAALTGLLQEENEKKLPITSLAALNTFLFHLEEDNPSDSIYWNPVYDLVKDGRFSRNNPMPNRVCEEWENNYHRLIANKIESTNIHNSKERLNLLNDLHSFNKVLGVCQNISSQDKIFKLLMATKKIDLAFVIEWDEKNLYQAKNKTTIKNKGVNDPYFLEAAFFFDKDATTSPLALKAISKLTPEVLNIAALKKLDLGSTHKEYLEALVQRAAQIYDEKGLSELHDYLSLNKQLVDSLCSSDRMRMTLEVIKRKRILPRNILAAPHQNRQDMERVVAALIEGNFSRIESLSLIVKMADCSDSIKLYLDNKPILTFDELIEFINTMSKNEYRGFFSNSNYQNTIFRKISEQILNNEYTIENLIALQKSVLKTKTKLSLPGLNPVFFRALKILQDPNLMAQVHRIWLETMHALSSDKARLVIPNGSKKDYLKAVLAAIQAEDENLILEYPAFSRTSEVREEVFQILMKSDLSNEFIQKWLESVFANPTDRQEQKLKEKFLLQLSEQRPAHSLEDVARFLNRITYTKLDGSKIPKQIWHDCKHIFRTVPAAEFSSDKVKRFSRVIKNDLYDGLFHIIPTLSLNGWYLKHTAKENISDLVQIFESIRDLQKKYSQVNKIFYHQMETHFGKLIQAVAQQNPVLLFDSFTPASFSKIGGASFSTSRNWEQELWRMAKKAGVDSQSILRLLIHRQQASLLFSFVREYFSDFDPNHGINSRVFNTICNILSAINDDNLRDQTAENLIYSTSIHHITWENIPLILSHISSLNLHNKVAFDLIFNIHYQDVTQEQIFALIDSVKDSSPAHIYAMLKLLSLTEDPLVLASIHSFLAKYAAPNKVPNLAPGACRGLKVNFEKMVAGSFSAKASYTDLKFFTPAQLGCLNTKKSEQKYRFRVLLLALQMGAIDLEDFLIELQDDKICHSLKMFNKAIELAQSIRPLNSFQDLVALLKSTSKRKPGFKLNYPIFDKVMGNFPDAEFEPKKTKPLSKYLDPYDQKQVLLRLAKVTEKEITWDKISLFLSQNSKENLNNQMIFDLIFKIPSQDLTQEQIFPFARSFKDASNAPVYAMLRLLEFSQDPLLLASIHSFLTKYAATYKVHLDVPEACSILSKNFDRIVAASFSSKTSYPELKSFTPVQLGCFTKHETSTKKIEQKYKFRILTAALQSGVIDREDFFIELQDPEICDSWGKFYKALALVQRIKPLNSFDDLHDSLKSASKKRPGFKFRHPIFDQVIGEFPATEFEAHKIENTLKYLSSSDQHQIFLRLAKLTRSDADMDFLVRHAGALALVNESPFEKSMMGSIRQDPQNIFKFPILTVAKSAWPRIVLQKDYYPDDFIQNQLIEYWISSDAPKEYLLAWLRFLPSDLGKRDRALKYFIQRAGLKSLADWTKLVKKANMIIQSKKEEEPWLKDKEKVINMLWHEDNLILLFASLPPSELTSQRIVQFVQSHSKYKVDIDKAYALNSALLKASSTKDYLKIHAELVQTREFPLEFGKNVEYMKKYMKMIHTVMDHNPPAALSFYELPIAVNILIRYLPTDKALRKRYAALDALADNLMANNQHWPPGMPWLWISKYIPSIPETISQGPAFLNVSPARPRTDPTEAIIEIAARRGVLSFKDIPAEIESARAINDQFALDPQTQKVILERLPRESFTFENLKSYADIDAVWTKQVFGESILSDGQSKNGPDTGSRKTLFELQLERRTDRPDLLKMYLKTKRLVSENPILTYDLENSEKMQKVFINKMRENEAWPKNLKQQHEILFSLAKRGPSELTDDLLYELYMRPAFKCWSCIEKTMKSHAFWDLHRRKEIYEKYLDLTEKAIDKQNFTLNSKGSEEYAANVVATVNLFFPIPSMERSEILEKLANDIKADEKLTHMIEDEKGRGIHEEAALGLGLYLMNKILNIYPGDEERMALVKFFVRNDPLPEVIARRFRQQVGVNRLRRQFLELPAYGKALAINALIVNLLFKSNCRQELEHMIWDNVQDENRNMAKLFYRSFVKSLRETAPFQESMFVAFLLGQLANVQGSHPGEKLKYILESLGGTGISIGQKIYQRRMIPDEYLEHLKNMTDHSPLPSRKAIYDRLKILLGVSKINKVLKVQDILGGASTAIVVKVLFKDGHEAALKMTFEDLPKRTQVEFRKMETALYYLVEDGGSIYNRLRPVIHEVHDGLKGQEDLTLEQNKTAAMKILYETANASNDQVHFKVIKTLPHVGPAAPLFNKLSSEHIFMELAPGKTLTRLNEKQKQAIFPAIFKKEMSILLADPDERNMVYFEKDRHMGNFIADFSAMPVKISVFDYPLFSSISAQERNSLFKLIGWLEARRIYGTNVFTQKIIDGKIADLLATEIAEAPLKPGKIAKLLSTAFADKGETSEKLFALFAIIDDVGTKDKIRVRPALIAYSIALGHAERYSQLVQCPSLEGAFRAVLKPYILKSDAEFRRMIPTESENVSLETIQESFEHLSLL